MSWMMRKSFFASSTDFALSPLSTNIGPISLATPPCTVFFEKVYIVFDYRSVSTVVQFRVKNIDKYTLGKKQKMNGLKHAFQENLSQSLGKTLLIKYDLP